jgi:hypothetical protein
MATLVRLRRTSQPRARLLWKRLNDEVISDASLNARLLWTSMDDSSLAAFVVQLGEEFRDGLMHVRSLADDEC